MGLDSRFAAVHSAGSSNAASCGERVPISEITKRTGHKAVSSLRVYCLRKVTIRSKVPEIVVIQCEPFCDRVVTVKRVFTDHCYCGQCRDAVCTTRGNWLSSRAILNDWLASY
jgi:hypothetical protein